MVIRDKSTCKFVVLGVVVIISGIYLKPLSVALAYCDDGTGLYDKVLPAMRISETTTK